MEGAVAAVWMGFCHGIGFSDYKCITLDHVGACATIVLPDMGCQHSKNQAFHQGAKGISWQEVRLLYSMGMAGGIHALCVPSDAMGTKGEKPSQKKE